MTPANAWTDHFPALRHLPDEVRAYIEKTAAVVTLPAGARIYGPGQSPQNFLLLLQGSVRVQQVSENGREIVLYRVAAGESCALTTAALLSDESYLAEAVTEEPTRAVTIPRAAFQSLLDVSAEFRRFVFAAFGTRMVDLFRIIDQVAFAHLDIRLADKILELSHGEPVLTATQQQLASELGTTREVVSRILLEFQKRGWLHLSRGSMSITDREALQALSHAH